MVYLTKKQMTEVMVRTGATQGQVEKIAAAMPAVGEWLRWGIIKLWSCARCITCLGIARKVFWCIVCVATTPPT